MPALKLRIPKVDRAFYGAGTLSVLAKARLIEALSTLEERAAPTVPLQSEPSEPPVTIWISTEQQQQLDALAVVHQINGAGPTASGLLHAWATQDRGSSEGEGPTPPAGAASTLDRINRALGDGTRPDQARFYAGMAGEALARRPPHEVILAEASTGVGKTRAFLSVVLDWVEANPGEHAVVALPSYAVVLQTMAQWDRIGAVHALPEHEVLVGMQEFVSAHALERILAESPDSPGAELARAWHAGGGKPPPDDLLGHPWLQRSLQVATGGLWNLGRECVLDTDSADDDPGMVAYRRQFVSGRAASVIFCTHAMLAVDVRLRVTTAAKKFADSEGGPVDKAAWESWQRLAEEDRRTSRTWEIRNEYLRMQVEEDAGRLPAIGLLVVDEAHLLEQQFASTFASGTSMARLMSDLRRLHQEEGRLVLKRDLEQIEASWEALSAYAAEAGTERAQAVNHGELRAAIADVGKVLDGIVARMSAKASARREARKLKAVKLALDVAARATGERGGMRVQVSWSPSLKWPSIVVGRYDVSRELDFLWALMVNDRSILVSATLFDDVSRLGFENMRRVLSIRQSLVRPLPPVRPAWLYEPVSLYVAGTGVHADGLPRFRRPVQNDRLDSIDFVERQERWRNDVARYIKSAYDSAAGGMLVLLTSHAERAQLQLRLLDLLPPDCLLSQSEGTTVDSLQQRFLRLLADSKRPCLLGVGSAWTGLDISGDGLAALTGRPVPAREDNVLTDLVIPIAPLGTNRTLTQEWRRERTGVIAEIASMAMTFRQGLGRLVRREGLPANRRIHFLDARIHEAKWASVLRPVMQALGKYARRYDV